MKKAQYNAKSRTIICGGESPETRHGRIQSEIMNNETQRMNAERYEDHTIIRGSAEEQVEQLKYAIKTYEDDLAMYRKLHKQSVQDTLTLQARIRQLEAQLA
jgi:hypothetical protein